MTGGLQHELLGPRMALAAVTGCRRLHVLLLLAGLLVGGAPSVSAQSAGDPATAPATAP